MTIVATHTVDGQPVKVVQWKKDGDHPLVERYPIERREFKGLLRTGNGKEKWGLRFGEFIVEDQKGRFWVEASQTLPAKYIPIK